MNTAVRPAPLSVPAMANMIVDCEEAGVRRRTAFIERKQETMNRSSIADSGRPISGRQADRQRPLAQASDV